MDNRSAREMLGALPIRMNEGGDVNEERNKTLLEQEAAYLANPSSWTPETAYNAIIESGISVQDALDAGVKQSTIDMIFTAPAETPAYSGPAATAPMADDVAAYYGRVMQDKIVSPEERLDMQKIATDRGISYADMVAAGVDPNILYQTTPAAKPVTPKTPVTVPIVGGIDPFPTGPATPAPDPFPMMPDTGGIYAAGQPALDEAFRASAPRTEVIEDVGGQQQLTGFDYTPAAKLLSATGSGFSFTPPSVTSRPRSLMGTEQLGRFQQGRAAQDFERLKRSGMFPDQASTPFDADAFNQLAGSYGSMSRSQLNALMRQQGLQNRAAQRSAPSSGGTIAEYIAANPDIQADYERQKGQLGGQNLNDFARNHYNTFGKSEMAAGTRTPFTLAALPPTPFYGFDEREEDRDYGSQPVYTTPLSANTGFNRTYGLMAEGGPVKKPKGFADGGSASANSMTPDELTAQLIAMEDRPPIASPDPLPTDQVQTESQQMLDNLLTKATRTPFTPEGERSIFGNVIAGIPAVAESVYDYGKDVVTAPSPSLKVATDAVGMLQALKQAGKEDPVGVLAQTLPPFAQVNALNQAEELTKQANQARAEGDFEKANRLEEVITVIALGAFPFGPKGAKPNVPTKPINPSNAAKMLENLTPERLVTETPKLDAPVPRLEVTETIPVAPVEVIAEAKGHALPSILLTTGTGEKATIPVVQTFTPKNKQKVLSDIETVITNNPEALTSPESWLNAEAQAFGGDYLPSPPSQAISYNQTPAALAKKLDRLTPQLKATVDEGFGYVNEIKNLYNSKIATPDLTGRMFLWGILSRGAGPVQQEAAFLDLVSKAEPYITKSVNGEFTDADLVSWKKMVSESLPEGSPAKQVTMNANAAGTLLKALSEKSPSGQSALQTLHNDLADPNTSGPQFRRRFFELTNKPGIDNKVVSFIGLVSGKDDLLVMDRIQSRHLWDDGRYEGKNIYDGIDKGGLSNILGGPRGLMVTEMLENGLKGSAKKAYEMIGRPQDGSLGRMHWETWLIEGNQGVSHSTLQSVRSGSPIGFGVTEGKPATFSSGMTYRQAINGPVVEYPLKDGNVVRMTPERQKEFEKFVKNPKSGIVPKGFKVSESTSGPWYQRPEVNRGKLDDAARQFENANPDGSLRSGDVRPYTGGDTLSQRRRQFLRSFRADQSRRAAATGVVQGLDNGRRPQEAPGPYQRGAVEGYGGNGLLEFSPDSNALTQYRSAGLNLPVIQQVDAVTNAPSYFVDMSNAMSKHRLGAQVEIKNTEDLSGYNLFRTEAGSGFAIKPDGDVVAVFASPNEPKGGSFAMLQAAVQAGGTKLDAFDTYLPEIYEAVGFRPVARLPWNDEFAPPNWDKKAFSKYSKGEPDVVFFVHDPKYFGGAKDVPVVTDYDDAVRLQNEALGTSSNAPQSLIYDAEKIAKLPRVANDPVALRFNEQVGADLEAAIRQYRQLPETKGGKILNTDFARELNPEYRKDRTLSGSVQITANEINEIMYQQALRDTMGQEDQWVFTGGGAASGKTAGLPDEMVDEYDLVADGTLANFEKSSAQIDQALDSGKAVTVIYVDRSPEKAFPLLLSRANKMEKELGSGRTVPLNVFLGAHRDARQSIKKISDKYKNDDRVAIQIVNNQGGEGEQFITTVDKISKMDYDTSLVEITNALEDAYGQNKISESIYRSIKGDTQPQSTSAQGQTLKNDVARNAGDEPKLKQGNQVTADALEVGVDETLSGGQRLKNYTPDNLKTLETLATKATAGTRKADALINAPVEAGSKVGIRLNLNSKIPDAPKGLDKLQTLHKNNFNGKALSYVPYATVENVTFNVNQKGRQGIAAKISNIDVPEAKNKFPAMSVDGNYAPDKNVLLDGKDFVEIGFNPKAHHLFIDMNTGQAVKGADLATVVGDRVYAKGIQYYKKSEAPDPLNASDGTDLPSQVRYQKMKRGGSVERVYNDPKYI